MALLTLRRLPREPTRTSLSCVRSEVLMVVLSLRRHGHAGVAARSEADHLQIAQNAELEAVGPLLAVESQARACLHDREVARARDVPGLELEPVDGAGRHARIAEDLDLASGPLELHAVDGLTEDVPVDGCRRRLDGDEVAGGLEVEHERLQGRRV